MSRVHQQRGYINNEGTPITRVHNHEGTPITRLYRQRGYIKNEGTPITRLYQQRGYINNDGAVQRVAEKHTLG